MNMALSLFFSLPPPSPYLPALGSPPHQQTLNSTHKHLLKLSPIPRETTRYSRPAVNSNGPTKDAFLDENGVVADDMDGYLNQLSLEYESVWDTKPSWCQPWTIALTGVLAIASSWLVFHSVVVTTLVSSLVCPWWYIFLYSYPKAYSNMIAERRKNVTDGVEDTFGLRNPQ